MRCRAEFERPSGETFTATWTLDWEDICYGWPLIWQSSVEYAHDALQRTARERYMA